MTSPNEWWKEEPYATTIKDPYCLVDHTIYNIPAIIKEVKRRERKTAKFGMADVVICDACKHSVKEVDNYCRNCGAKFE